MVVFPEAPRGWRGLEVLISGLGSREGPCQADDGQLPEQDLPGRGRSSEFCSVLGLRELMGSPGSGEGADPRPHRLQPAAGSRAGCPRKAPRTSWP